MPRSGIASCAFEQVRGECGRRRFAIRAGDRDQRAIPSGLGRSQPEHSMSPITWTFALRASAQSNAARDGSVGRRASVTARIFRPIRRCEGLELSSLPRALRRFSSRRHRKRPRQPRPLSRRAPRADLAAEAEDRDFFPAKVVMGIIKWFCRPDQRSVPAVSRSRCDYSPAGERRPQSSQLQRRKACERQHHGNDQKRITICGSVQPSCS